MKAVPKNNFVPGDVTYEDCAKSVKRSLSGYRQNRIATFGDSIICRILVRDFNKELDTGHAKIRTFPGANSKKFSYYVTVVILHIVFNNRVVNSCVKEGNSKND